MDITVLPMMGYPIQKSPDQYLFSGSPKLIAAFHVFLRLLAPRHPPFALHSLATIKNTNKFKRFDANILYICFTTTDFQRTNMVEDSGIEPLTSCVQGRRSPS